MAYLFGSRGLGTGLASSRLTCRCPSCFSELFCTAAAAASFFPSAESAFGAADLCDDILFSSSLWMALGGGSGEGSLFFG